ncbi:PREDICTED: endothelin-converting enzyme 2-like, partial [Calidris pugnax]|uniref:endothelin-converting enzyme 2-like n=1 Tax=Calidris pugnax TaxID=198806 RepID=UPI00071E683B
MLSPTGGGPVTCGGHPPPRHRSRGSPSGLPGRGTSCPRGSSPGRNGAPAGLGCGQCPRGHPDEPLPRAGCGNSALSHDLHERGYPDVTSVDFSPACIAAMRARYARCPRLRWAVMDIRALAFPDAAFDVVLEKGTLDVFMAEETDPWHVSPRAAADMHRALAEVSRVLRPGGCFISITFAQPHFRKPHLAQEAFGWSLRHVPCGDGDPAAFHYFLY